MQPPTIPEQPVPVLQEEPIRALLNTDRSRDFLDLRDTAIIRPSSTPPCAAPRSPGCVPANSTSTKTWRSCSARPP
ncbi:MAG: hypothetical protein ACRDZO_17475 [Egibacteraceae bacterium]